MVANYFSIYHYFALGIVAEILFQGFNTLEKIEVKSPTLGERPTIINKYL